MIFDRIRRRSPLRSSLRHQNRKGAGPGHRRRSARLALEHLEDRALPAGLAGIVFDDANDNRIRNTGEDPMSGVTVFLDLNDNGVRDTGATATSIEPDDYAPGQILDTVDPRVTLTATFQGTLPRSVVATAFPPGATTGSLVFAPQGISPTAWSGAEGWLEMDFATPVNTISLDYFSVTPATVGELELYDAGGNLIQTVTTPSLSAGQSATLQASVAGVASAIAKTSIGGSPKYVALDNLIVGSGTTEPIAVTNANGEYAFTGLSAGDYVIREIVPFDFRQTSPTDGERLFNFNSVPDPDRIVEVSPIDGSVVHWFPAPVQLGSPLIGLAASEDALYFTRDIGAGDTLYEIDPDLGTVLDTMALPAGT